MSSKCFLWHNRMGHAPLDKLRNIGCSNDNLPFNLSKSYANLPFELIQFIDICDRYKVLTKNNHMYFRTIVDDHSRATWGNLIKSKSDAFGVIHSFVKFTEIQFKSSVKIIRSVYNPQLNTDKYTHGGVPCMFIAYPRFRKGQKLLNLMIKSFFVSRDVKFNEAVFPCNHNNKQPSYFHSKHVAMLEGQQYTSVDDDAIMMNGGE
ncbi:Retrovirus-related Pol polyprotein from transposon TNT 1-94 [Bienertia sinuspersici]